MYKLIFTLSRIIVGITFLFSGFVKAVDPVGSTIKFTDYFNAFHLEGFIFWVMPMAFILAALEFLTGLHLILGLRIKSFSIIATIFMAFFTPLTLGLAIFNPVTDCGCFGDALKLTNWQTFGKNIIVLIPTLYLFFHRKKYINTISNVKKIIITVGFTIAILFISSYSLNHLPILDFRPYSIGNNIAKGMVIPTNAEKAQYETTFILEKNGVQKEFSSKDYPYNDSTWVFIDSKTKVIKEGYEPPIHDFVLLDDNGIDQASTILNNDTSTLLVISSKIKKGEWTKNLNKINLLKRSLYERGIKTYVLTASSNEDITDFEYNNEAGFDYLISDETMLKTIIRSNPGLVLLQKGNVIGKWHYNDIPKAEEFVNPVSYSLKELANKKSKYVVISLLLASMVFSTLLMRKNKQT